MATTKKLFSRGVLPIYKDRNIAVNNLVRWTKLTIHFEDSESKIKRGSLFAARSPRYASTTHQTGLVVIGFGLHSTLFAQFGKYFTNEWLLDCNLGTHTVDHWASSPLIAKHACGHIDRAAIEAKLSKFVGDVTQTNAPMDYKSWLDMKHGVRRQAEGEDEEVDARFDDEAGFIDNDDLSTYIDDLNEQQSAESEDLSPQKYLQQQVPSLERVRRCHSIEVLGLDHPRLRLRVRSDGIFDCRALVRDFGSSIGCHAALERLHLRAIGPLTDEMALARHELHLNEIIQSMATHTPAFDKYLAELRQQHPEGVKYVRYM